MDWYRIPVVAICIVLAWAIPAQADPLSDFGVIRSRVQMPAPDFTLSGLEGKTGTLGDLKGKVVLLHFWATWCVPCRTEMPLLQNMWHANRERGLEVLCVNVDRGNRESVKKFMQDIKLHFHTLLDPDGEVRNTYEVFGLPTTYIIGRDGKIVGRIIGERDWHSPHANIMIQGLLAGEGDIDRSD